MPNIFHQSVDDILKAATPEQKLLWNYIFLRWGERLPVSQLFYSGVIAGTEFLTYSANKLYVYYDLEFTGLGTERTASENSIMYNEVNAAKKQFTQINPFWDATAASAKMYISPVIFKNDYFSRLLMGSAYLYIRFNGYRISI